jgi:hypothetical protein
VEPTLKTSVPDWAGKHRNWCLMGFQRPDLPQSDLRGCGVLTLHVLLYLVKEHRDLIFSLLCCQSMRKDGYPFAASVINIIQLLIKELQPDSSGADSSTFLYLARFSDVEHSFAKIVLELSVLVERIWTVRQHRAAYRFVKAFSDLNSVQMNSLEYMDYPRVLQSVMHVLSTVSFTVPRVMLRPKLQSILTFSLLLRPSAPARTP